MYKIIVITKNKKMTYKINYERFLILKKTKSKQLENNVIEKLRTKLRLLNSDYEN